MPSKRRPQARRTKQPRARNTKSISENIVQRSGQSRNFDRLTPRQQDAYSRAIRVLRQVRRGDSLSEAARDLGTTPQTVRRYFPTDFSKSKGSRQWSASKSDRHLREMKIVGDKGMEPFRVRGSQDASRLAKYLAAVHKAVSKNDPTALADFQGQKIAGRELITSLSKLLALAKSGDLSFEDLYSVGAA